jgi:hypothetical protein
MGGVPQAVECLLSKALSSKPSFTHTQKKRKKKKMLSLETSMVVHAYIQFLGD